MDKVYIVLVNHNNYEDTIECIESLLKSTYINYQLFVIDNSLSPDPVKQLKNWAFNNCYSVINTNLPQLIFPLANKPIDCLVIPESGFNKTGSKLDNKLIIIKSNNNGFAAANNIALRYLLNHGETSSLIWLLNNDTVVENTTLSNMVNYYNENSDKKYILGSKLMYYNKADIIQAVAGNYNIWLGKHIHIGNNEKDNGQYDHYIPKKNDYIIGASLFLPKLFLEQAGLMCEDYFLYFEELDWIKSGMNKGYSIAFVPNAIVYHKEGSSIVGVKNKDTTTAEYYSITNRVRFIKKWYPYTLPTVMIGVTWALVKRLLLGKFYLVKKTSVTIFKILFLSK